MQRGGKRKSPFVGGSELLDGGILYSRVTDLSSVLLDGEAPAAAGSPAEPALKKEKREKKEKRKDKDVKKSKAEEAVVAAEPAPAPGAAAAEPAPGQKPRKKARWTDEQKAAARAEREAAAAAKKGKGKGAAGPGPADGAEEPAAADPAADGDAGGKKEKKKKKAAGPVRLAPEERVSGPGNADEAQRMRQALGFVAPAPAASPAAGKLAFSFGFASGGTQAAAATQDKKETSSSSSSDDGSSSDEEEEQEKAAAGGAGSSSDEEETSSSEGEEGEEDAGSSSSEDEEEEEEESSSSSEEESSSSDDDSSSGSEDEGGKPAPAAAVDSSDSNGSSSSSSSSDSEDEAAGQQQARGDGEYVPRRVYVGGMPYGYTEDQIWEYWGYCGEIEGLDMMTFPDTGRFRGIVFITFKTEEGYQAALACNGEQCDGQTLKVMKCRPSAKDRQQMQAARQGQQGEQAQQQPGRQQFAPPASYENGAAGEAAAGAQGTPVWARTQTGGQERKPRQQQEQRLQEQGNGHDGGAAPRRPQHSGPAPKTPGYHVAYVGNVAYEADDKALARLFEPCGVVKVRLHTDKDTGKPKGFAHVHFRDEAGLDQAVQLDGTSLLGRRIRVGYAQPKKEQPAQ